MLEELDSLHPGDGTKEIPRSRMYYNTDPKTIAELNLETELVEHYVGLKSYLIEIAGGGEGRDDKSSNYSPSQVAQVTNSLTAVLDKIIKMQESVVNLQRMSQVESALVDCIKSAPADVQEAFFIDYEKILKKYENK